MVLYRKYRPQTLDELIGQERVKQTLWAAFKSNKLAHAYLFCGPRGTGKTSTARILAKMVNCEGKQPPCNTCQFCTSITDGSNLDLVEIDAASNRGIDDIRALKENIKLAPTSAKKKIYIIDEVHMLTGEAFNALLKTLEEPPPHAMFLLATTEAQKIPQTILSRVQRLDFKLASADELKQALIKVAREEKMSIDDEALTLVAKAAQGSFRDAIKLLDQLSSLAKIDRAAIELSLGGGQYELVLSVLLGIAKSSPKQALVDFNKLLEMGSNPKELNLTLLDIFRQLLYVKNDLGKELVLPEVGEQRYLQLCELANNFGLNKIVAATEAFTKSLEQLRYVPVASLPLEVAIIQSCQEAESAPVEQPLAEEVKIVVPQSQSIQQPPPEEVVVADNPKSVDIQKIQERWPYILETIRPYNYSLEALLRSVKILECSEKNVLIEVPYSFHQRILEAPKSRDLLESVLSDVLGRTVKISTILGTRPARVEELANVEVAADDEVLRVAAEIFSSDS